MDEIRLHVVFCNRHVQQFYDRQERFSKFLKTSSRMAKAKRKRRQKAAKKKASRKNNDTKKSPQAPAHPDAWFGIPMIWIVCLFLGLVTLAVYWQVLDHGFITYDDDKYVTNNPYIQRGLTLESIRWSFTTLSASNWHPLTWISHIIDYQIFGLNSGGHHLTSLLLHIANTLAVLFVFKRMTQTLWQSAFVAGLFALHPLHVESVAWVAERKDVLSTFFGLLSLWGYARYVEHPEVKRYLLPLVCFALGLMAKPMLVTVPFVLLLLDYWPLQRFRLGQSGNGRLILEKTPFFILTTASCIVTYIAQKSGGAVISSEVYSFTLRVANAQVSYIGYIGKMLWPAKLALLYPHPLALSWWQIGGAGFLFVAISLLAIKNASRRPYVLVGWLWYLGMLVPVIGLVQVGAQAMADRYTYMPLVGLFVIAAWGAPDLVAAWRFKTTGLAIMAGTILLALTTMSVFQVGYWRDSIKLFEHTLMVTEKNYIIHNNLGVELKNSGRISEAIHHYEASLRINSKGYADAHNNYANIIAGQGRLAEAIRHYSDALRINPENAEVHNNLGVALFRNGNEEDAISHFKEAIRIRPDLTEAHHNLQKVVSLPQQ